MTNELWGCTDTECTGDCTWCNRAPAENKPLLCDEKSYARRYEELLHKEMAMAQEIRALRSRVAEYEARDPRTH